MKYFAAAAAVVLAITAWLSLRTPELLREKPPPIPVPKEQVFTAAFLIYTNNVKRSFSSPMYHRQSSRIFLTPENPQIVHVTAPATWAEFFQTLPMSLTQTCLITGTGERYCTGTEGTLRFFLNEEEDPNALARAIAPGDRLLVSYGFTTELDLTHQIQAVPLPSPLDTPTPTVEQ